MATIKSKFKRGQKSSLEYVMRIQGVSDKEVIASIHKIHSVSKTMFNFYKNRSRSIDESDANIIEKVVKVPKEYWWGSFLYDGSMTELKYCLELTEEREYAIDRWFIDQAEEYQDEMFDAIGIREHNTEAYCNIRMSEIRKKISIRNIEKAISDIGCTDEYNREEVMASNSDVILQLTDMVLKVGVENLGGIIKELKQLDERLEKQREENQKNAKWLIENMQ